MNDSVSYTVAVIADIHGNAVALNAVLEDLKRRPYDCLVVAGDLVLNGPRPSECLDTIRNLGAPTIYGNADLFVFDEEYAFDGVGLGEREAWIRWFELSEASAV